jgi:germination protein M
MAFRRRLGSTLLGTALLTLAACGPATVQQSTRTTDTTVASSPSATPTAVLPAASTSAAPVPPSGVAPATSAAPATTSSGSVSAARSTAAPAASSSLAGPMTVEVYFTSGKSLVSEARPVSAAAPARGSLEALLAGPSGAGHFSQVPAGTRLLSLNLAGGIATVSFSDQVQTLQGSPAIPLFLGQVVDTLTQFPDIQRVVLEVNGQPLRTLGGEGVAVPEPLDRAAVQRLLTGT